LEHTLDRTCSKSVDF